MSELTIEVAQEQIGKKQFDELLRLRERLYGISPKIKPSLRYAPSMIVRSEAELFGVSMPRFAIRVGMGDAPVESFINARRLVPFRDQMRRAHDPSIDIFQPPAARAGKRRRSAPSCIADSLLARPRTGGFETYHLLTTDLHASYGELEYPAAKDDRCEGHVPYVEHIQIGGGLCAQASCWMATALMHRFAAGVYGVAEATALVHDDSLVDIRLGGLGWADIVRYFAHPTVSLQPHRNEGTLLASRKSADKGHRVLSAALRGYLRSGYPIIFAVDLGRVRGLCLSDPATSIAATNGLPNLEPATDSKASTNNSADPFRRRNHCVVLVGFDNDSFVVMDPALKPFLKATTEQLRTAGTYSRTPSNASDKFGLRAPEFLAVTDVSVKLPLVGFNESTDRFYHSQRAGVIQLFLFCQQRLAERGNKGRKVFSDDSSEPHMIEGCLADVPAYDPESADYPGEFYLVQGNAEVAKHLVTWHRTDQRSDAGEREDTDPVLALANQYRERAHDEERPLWIQEIQATEGSNVRSAWIWRADYEAPYFGSSALKQKNPNAFGALAAVYRYPTTDQEERWIIFAESAVRPRNIDFVDSQIQPATSCGATTSQEQLKPALLTSYTWERSLVPLMSRSQSAPCCEMYTFMQPDVEHWRERLSEYQDNDFGGLNTALDVMAAAEGLPEIIKSWVRDTTSRAKQNGKKSIIALASFFSEVTRPIGSIDNMKAQKAIRFMMRAAAELQECGHPCRTIEIVSGSRINSIRPVSMPLDPDDRRACDDQGHATATSIHSADQEKYSTFYVAERMSDFTAQTRLLSTLSAALQEARFKQDRANSEKLSAVKIAIEAEPGPLFVARDETTLRSLCRSIEADDVLKSCVGVNLDLAHWRLAKIVAEGFADRCPEVFRRIAHAHASGHHASGHFGDCIPQLVNTTDHFSAWLELLRRRVGSCGESVVPFSGYVSLEYEVAKSEAHVTSAYSYLQELLS